MQFTMQLVHFHRDFVQSFSANTRDFVHAPLPPRNTIQVRLQQSRALHSMQQRIQRTRPDPVAVMRKFLHHRQTENRLMRGVHQHMDANQPVIKFALRSRHTYEYTVIPTPPPCVLSNFDI
jgi:hypothetical protein